MLFNSLFAHAVANQNPNAKRKAFKLSRKVGQQSAKASIPIDPDTMHPDAILAAAEHAPAVDVGFASPVGFAQGQKVASARWRSGAAGTSTPC